MTTRNMAWPERTERSIIEIHRKSVPHSLPSGPPSQAAPTLYDEVDPRGLWMVVCLHRAGVGAFVVHIHVLDLNAVLGLGVAQENHTRIQAPLVIPSIENGAAV